MIDTSDPHLHDAVHTAATLELGVLHWYLTRAVSLIDAKSRVHERKAGTPFTVTHLTSFGELVAADEVRWWVWMRESDLHGLRTRTAEVFGAARMMGRVLRIQQTEFGTRSDARPALCA